MDRKDHRISSEALRHFVRELFGKLGCSREALRCIEAYFVQVGLFGNDTHGLMQVPTYVRDVQRGKICATASIEIVRDSGVTAVLEGNNGIGVVTATLAMELAISKSKSHGVGIVAVRGGNHFGAAGYYPHLAVVQELVGVAVTNGAGGHIAPWGSLTPLISNNPIAIGVPAGNQSPLLLDVSLSVAARGKIMSAVANGQDAIPEGWATDIDGRPTTDPNVALSGLLRLIGDHKGSGLSIALGMLSACLSGAAFDSDIEIESPKPRNTGHLMVAIDPQFFLGLEEFKARADSRLNELRQARPISESGMYLPGDRAHRTALIRKREGIPVSPSLLNELSEIRSRLSITAPLT